MRILKKILKALAALLLFVVALAAFLLWWTHPKRPVNGSFVREAGRRDVQVHRHPARTRPGRRRGGGLRPEAPRGDDAPAEGAADVGRQLDLGPDQAHHGREDEVQRLPDHRGRRHAARDPADRVLGRPARRRHEPLDRLPGGHGARGVVGPRPPAAVRGRGGEGDPGPGRHAVGRGLRQPAAAPVVGPGAGDPRRGPVPPRRAVGRLGGGGPGPQRDGVRQALRAQLHRGDPHEGGRPRGRAHVARGLPAALRAPGRGERRLLHERLQPGERRLLRREPAPPPRDPQGGVGLPRLRDVGLLQWSLRREEGGPGRARPRDALDAGLRQDAGRRGREGRGAPGRDRRGGAAPAAPEDRVRDAPRPDGLPGVARARPRARGARPRGRGEGHGAAEERRRPAAARRGRAPVGGGPRPPGRRAEPRRLRQQPGLPARHRHRRRGPARGARRGARRPRARRRPREGAGGGEGRVRGGGRRGLRRVGRGRVHPGEAEQGGVGRRPRGPGAEARRPGAHPGRRRRESPDDRGADRRLRHHGRGVAREGGGHPDGLLSRRAGRRRAGAPPPRAARTPAASCRSPSRRTPRCCPRSTTRRSPSSTATTTATRWPRRRAGSRATRSGTGSPTRRSPTPTSPSTRRRPRRKARSTRRWT